MAIYLLDTSVIIDCINGKRNREQLPTELLQQDHLLAWCPINVTEVYASWPVARLAGLIKRDYSKKGITLATTDVTVAAVALYHQLTLMTGNVKHYPMKDLSLYLLP